MSEDMSMFRKMKDKITDEVSSATNRLQNMQIIDHLATSIGQQVARNDGMPHQRLPELPRQIASTTNSHFSLNDSDTTGQCEDEELNADISPQHQLFDGQSIQRLRSPSANKSPNQMDASRVTSSSLVESNNEQSVIDINHLSSDLEDDIAEISANDDTEIDLLADKKVSINEMESILEPNRLATYKLRYRNVVHAFRKLNDDRRLDRFQLETETKKLTDQVFSLKQELQSVRQQLHIANLSANDTDSEKKNSNSPQPSNKNNKIRDLEKLMAKCKESLKSKNAQLNILKSSLNEVEKFKELMDELKCELKELRNAHETWTLSIAENKRVMHQEIEEKNVEMNSIRSQLKDSNNHLMQQKSNIQNLESRLVSMSAAHQKERESLIKELTNAKNNAIKRLQKEHELQLERVKLDLEKSIEALKSDILVRDEQIIRSGQRQQELEKQNCNLTTDLENHKKRCQDHLVTLDALRRDKDSNSEKIGELEGRLNDLQNFSSEADDLKSRNEGLERQAQDLNKKILDLSQEVSNLKDTNEKITKEMNTIKASAEQEPEMTCSSCEHLQDQLKKLTERQEQALFELHAKLNLMTTANTDQERAINDLKTERAAALETIKDTKVEVDELSKKNESLLQVLQDNDSEMQSQQEQLSQLALIKQQLENSKKENAALYSSLDQMRNELDERGDDLAHSNESIEELRRKLEEAGLSLQSNSKELENLKLEKDSLTTALAYESNKRKEMDQRLVVNILSALKNLETPETSPGSDKTYQPGPQESSSLASEADLPDPFKLTEKLSSLALDRSNAYMTASQQLQAVLLDNTMINEEIKRLREELNSVSQEKTQEVFKSLEEMERLRSENQALIHDQKYYEDQIALYGADIESLKQTIKELEVVKDGMVEKSTETEKDFSDRNQELIMKDQEIERLKRLIDESRETKKSLQLVAEADIPSFTEFEYLKNIVYQFMIGREPVTLARVISAIFKFDKDQMEHICKIQETIHQL